MEASAVIERPVTAGELDPLARYRADVKVIVDFSSELTITTDEEAQYVAAVLEKIARKKKEINQTRLEITQPLNARQKAAIALEKEILEPLAPVDNMLRRGLENYHLEQQRRREEAERKIREERERVEREAAEAARKAEQEARMREYEAGRRKTEEAQERQQELAEEALQQAELARLQEEVAARSPLPEVAAPAKTGKAGVAMVWQATVIDPDQVPREYLKVDTAAINKAVREGAREIPGVDIKQVPRARVSAR